MKVSDGCNNCYAETLMDTRYKRVAWGQRRTETTEASVGTRVRTSKSNWYQPIKWQRQAAAFEAEHSRRRRVFCASLADVFDNQVPEGWRSDLFALIEDTPELDWLLLTKRPENIQDMLWPKWAEGLTMPRNIWLGTTCEDQAAYDKRWPILARIPAAVRFISYEPAIGPLLLSGTYQFPGRLPDWIICGGESGKSPRPMPEKWAAEIKDQCLIWKVPFFMKQMAGKKPIPEYLMRREFPTPNRKA